MGRYRFGSMAIASAGYDAQCQLLEIEFVQDGQVWQYLEVPEEVWYHFKTGSKPDIFFHNFIKGRYAEQRIEEYLC